MQETDMKTNRTAGRYVKESDPGTVQRLKDEGERTDLVSLGILLKSTDPETFDRVTKEDQS